jgi:hypothetical protein
VTQASIAQPRPQPTLIAFGSLAIEQQGEPFGMRQLGALRICLQLGERACHTGKPELMQLIESGMGEQVGISSVVIAGAADVGMVWQQLALPWLRWPPVEPVLEDRLDRAVRAGANVETTIARRFQPIGAVLACQPQDPQTGAVTLLGMRPALQDQSSKPGCAWADCRRVAKDPFDGPLGVAPMRARHVLGDCSVAARPVPRRCTAIRSPLRNSSMV